MATTETTLGAGRVLVTFGVVVVGLRGMVAGASHPATGEGQIVHEALIPVEIESYLVLAGILIWGLYAVYRITAVPPTTATDRGRRVETGHPE